MSSYAGELFVKITPDAAGFDASLQAQINRSATAAAKSPGTATAQEAQKLQNQLAGAVKETQRLQVAAEQAAAQFALGAISEKEATAALLAYGEAGQLAAKANVTLALATGQAIAAQDLQILAMKKAEEQSEHTAGRFRQQARRVAEGEASIGSLLAPSSLLKFGAGALAFGAVITTLQHVEEGLKVTGDEAFTTEGRFRNLGAALIKGDLYQGFKALNEQAPTAAENLKKLRESGEATQGGLSAFADKTRVAAAEQQKFVRALDAVGDNSSFANAVRDIADETAKASQEARNLAAGYVLAAEAAQEVAAQIAHAGSEAAQFGERQQGPVTPILTPRGSTGREFDSTATPGTQNSIAESIASRSKELNDDLAVAKREATQAAENERTLKGVVEGAAARHKATVDAVTRVAQIQNQIDAQAAQDAKSAAAKRKQAAGEAQRAYEQAAANEVQTAKIAADAAGHTGRAERNLIAVLTRESKDRRLTEQARLQYAADLVNERQNQKQAVAAAAKADIDYRKSVLDLAVQRAEVLTPKDDSDNKKALDAEIRFFDRQIKQAKKLGKAGREAVVELQSQRLSIIEKKNALSGKGGSGFTLAQLFSEAAGQFSTYGSNISGRNGVLSGQDERAAFAGTVLGNRNPGSGIPGQQLTEAQKQTALLAGILRRIGSGSSGGSPALDDRGKKGNLLAIYGTEIAAAYNYGVN